MKFLEKSPLGPNKEAHCPVKPAKSPLTQQEIIDLITPQEHLEILYSLLLYSTFNTHPIFSNPDFGQHAASVFFTLFNALHKQQVLIPRTLFNEQDNKQFLEKVYHNLDASNLPFFADMCISVTRTARELDQATIYSGAYTC